MRTALQRWMIFITLSVLTACSHLGESRSDYESQDAKAAELNMRLGLNYLQRGDYAIAMEKLQKALKQNPDLPSAHNTIALLYQRLGETDKAREHLEQAVRRAPDYSEAQNNFGVFLCRQGEYKESEKRFLKAIENPLYRSKARALENAGLCLQRVPDLQQAEIYFRQALQIEPSLPKSLEQMALLSYQQKNYLQARGYIQRYQQATSWTAPALLLGIKIENKLGDQNAVASYSLMLRSHFPDSDEMRMLNQGLIND